jgi:serine/threonine protein kinase
MDLTPFHGPPAAAPDVPGFVARTLLGFGAHGEVWEAEELTTGDVVALKVGRRATRDLVVPTGVPPDSSRPIAGSGEQETALLCRIDHPHIVRLRRVVPLDDAGLALVLDLASGGSLASLVAGRGTFDPGEVSTLLIPLAGALDHLHRRGVVHGDIAPGNVLFTEDGRPQLGDLGVARVLGARAADTWATPGFTDPGLTAKNGRIDSRAADLWSLAAVGWFALTGRAPEADVLAAATDPRAPLLTELLAECLALDPERRPRLDELADRAWQSARPTPVRLIAPRQPTELDGGLPPLTGRVTRRVLAASADGPDPDPVDDGSNNVSGAFALYSARAGQGPRRTRGPRWAIGHRRARRFHGISRRRLAGSVAGLGLLATGLGAVLMTGVINLSALAAGQGASSWARWGPSRPLPVRAPPSPPLWTSNSAGHSSRSDAPGRPFLPIRRQPV